MYIAKGAIWYLSLVAYDKRKHKKMTRGLISLQTTSATRQSHAGALGIAILSAVVLIWPALLNGYPLVFADTGTYILQVVERHLGWDRPAFYSFFLVALHWTLTTWPVVIIQGLLVLAVIWLVMRAIGGTTNMRASSQLVLLLAVTTALPWFAAQLMPDVFTGLLPLLLALLVLVPDRLAPWQRWAAALGTAAIVAVHLSHLPICLAVLVVLLPARRWLGATAPLGRIDWLRLALVPGLAAAALVGANAVGHGRASLSPYGSVFLLARQIYDGPALATLQRDCPDAGWRLCAIVGHRLPADADDFLWQPDSPLARLGGAVAIAGEASQVVRRTVLAQPVAVAVNAARNTLRQLTEIDSGDGLQAWPGTVTPVIRRDFPPAEAAMYQRSLQTRGRLAVPVWMQTLHRSAAVLGVAGTLAAFLAARRRRHPVAGLCAAVLVCILANAFVTGALSGPHDRYQSRVMWPAVLAPMVALSAMRVRASPTGRSGDAARPPFAAPAGIIAADHQTLEV